ncbi:hypothetical protein Pmar_PMAR028080 [Perkinsus marinus ATCC 50983]|uniref:Uncharacterized protein n=1 Tax=Perkinsus marinus (strain ATCC 50983 / TXsc) TaxID=423536 RepID=C5L5X7_PERM5|nr:hypothetical protein Pmar_PMAR028080 [Perkinsus marinus ATCC 50983]EER07861.1 hypothetical protein Pmar_PMAR028080 [Perkinsus marinus ATCC 50983]|eukprot:XP_002776045.1 hypothetical protein Pmar_PMAR028080 [Perkinsus marinus ATCC 50983]
MASAPQLHNSDPLDTSTPMQGEGVGNGFASWWWPVRFLGLSATGLTNAWVALRDGRRRELGEVIKKLEGDRFVEEERNAALVAEFTKLRETPEERAAPSKTLAAPAVRLSKSRGNNLETERGEAHE